MIRWNLRAAKPSTFVAVILLFVFFPTVSMVQMVPLSCLLTQITHSAGGDNINHVLSANGNRIAFASDMDLVAGGNADGNLEIFLYDVSSNTLSQITSTTGGVPGSNRPSLNRYGNLIVFESDRDFVPGANADGNTEIFLYDISSSSFTQVTNTTIQSNSFALINPDGTRIVFRSMNDFTGGNADGNDEIFLYDILSNSFTQITNTTGAGLIYTSSINADGTRIALNTTRDLVPGGNPDGNNEIFVHNTSTGVTLQVTNTTGGGNYAPFINETGGYIVFQSDRDLVPGTNADGNIEVFRYEVSTGSFKQITLTTGGENFSPSISADGNRIAFVSYNNINGGNPDLNGEVFLYDTSTNSITQLTDTAQVFVFFDPGPLIDSSGTRIAFRSYYDINGGNPDGTSGFGNAEIYLSVCPSRGMSATAVPALSEWGMVVLFLLMGLGCMAYLRRMVHG